MKALAIIHPIRCCVERVLIGLAELIGEQGLIVTSLPSGFVAGLVKQFTCPV